MWNAIPCAANWFIALSSESRTNCSTTASENPMGIPRLPEASEFEVPECRESLGILLSLATNFKPFASSRFLSPFSDVPASPENY